ncbi:MAG: hypothetical protein ABIO16_16170 [Nocardioides sp.]
MRERYLLGLTAVPFVVAALMPGALLPGDQVTRFQDPAIIESSGLVVVDGSLVTTNDSGDSGRLFTVDQQTGETTRVTHWSDDPVDVEALAPAGDGAVWVGDIGDNRADRDSVSVTRVDVVGDDTDRPTYDLVYPEGARDAESLLADPATGRLYVVSKGVFGGTLYAAPQRLVANKPNHLREVGAMLPVATDASFFPDGRHVIVRNYTEAAVYTWPDLDEIGRFGLPHQMQGEGIAVAEDGTIYASSEGLRSPVLTISLPVQVRRAMAPPTPSPTPTASPTPTTHNRVGKELPEQPPEDRSAWGWALGGVIGLGIVLVLVRAMRPR